VSVMNYVGLLYNCSRNTNPRERLSPSILNRVVLIDTALKQFDMRVFYYNPKHVTTLGKKIPGYVLKGDQFVATSQRVPTVNGNWSYQTRQLLDKGMGYNRFLHWIEENGVGVYVPLEFSELAVNKQQSYEIFRAYDPTLQPYSEEFRRSARQLANFVERSKLTFIKPRNGNKGDDIITVRRADKKLSVNYYKKGSREQRVVNTVRAANDLVQGLTKHQRKYVIQRGVEAFQYEGSVFDLRVIIVRDDVSSYCFHEARVSPVGSELSNVSQGATSVPTEEILVRMLGKTHAHRVLKELRRVAFGLAEYLDTLHPGELMEVAYDFLLDRDGRLYLLEINTKPGLPGAGFETSIFDQDLDQSGEFQRLVHPYVACLARFLKSKVDQHRE